MIIIRWIYRQWQDIANAASQYDQIEDGQEKR